MSDAASMWGSAPWERVAVTMATIHDRLITSLGPGAGERWLDVATGTGAVAFRAARAGARVTGLDLAPALIETARRLSCEQGLSIDFDVGDAVALPYTRMRASTSSAPRTASCSRPIMLRSRASLPACVAPVAAWA